MDSSRFLSAHALLYNTPKQTFVGRKVKGPRTPLCCTTELYPLETVERIHNAVELVLLPNHLALIMAVFKSQGSAWFAEAARNFSLLQQGHPILRAASQVMQSLRKH